VSTVNEGSKLRDVAKYQRAVLLSLLANVAIIVIAMLRVFRVIHMSPTMASAFGITAVVITLFIMGSMFMLSKQFTNVVMAGIIALLMFVPYLSLILLFVYNQKATTYLQQNRIKVGFLGVNPSSIR
jgi:hypothetical protein